MRRSFAAIHCCASPCVAARRSAVQRTSIISLIPAHSGLGGEGCSELAGECVSNPCEPTGTRACVEQVSGFKCVCRHGYAGRLCETPISHCVHGLCQHGSKCVDLRGGFTCECLFGKPLVHMMWGTGTVCCLVKHKIFMFCEWNGRLDRC